MAHNCNLDSGLTRMREHCFNLLGRPLVRPGSIAGIDHESAIAHLSLGMVERVMKGTHTPPDLSSTITEDEWRMVWDVSWGILDDDGWEYEVMTSILKEDHALEYAFYLRGCLLRYVKVRSDGVIEIDDSRDD